MTAFFTADYIAAIAEIKGCKPADVKAFAINQSQREAQFQIGRSIYGIALTKTGKIQGGKVFFICTANDRQNCIA